MCEKLEETAEMLRKVNIFYSNAIDDDEATASEYGKTLSQ